MGNYLPSLLPGVKTVDKDKKVLQDRVLDTMGPVAMLFEHVYGFLAETKPGENVILSYEQMKDLGANTSNALRLLGNASARLSLTKSVERELYHLSPRKSFRKLAKVCLGKDSKQGSRPDQRQQRPCFQLLLWSRIHDLLSFFEAAPPPSGDEGTAGVVPVKGFQMPATSASFGLHSEAEAELPEESCSKSLQPPSGEAFSLTTKCDVKFKSFSCKSPSPSRTPETLHFKLGCYKQRPLGLRNCSGVSSRPHECPTTIIHPTYSSSYQGEYGSYRPGNTTNARERSYPCDPPGTVTPRVCKFHFSSPPKRGWPEARSESPSPQSVIPYEHFKMEGIHMLRDLLRKGDFMVKIDLKGAYFTVPV